MGIREASRKLLQDYLAALTPEEVALHRPVRWRWTEDDEWQWRAWLTRALRR